MYGIEWIDALDRTNAYSLWIIPHDMDVILLTKNVVREEQSDKYMQEQFARSMVATYTTYPGAHTHTHNGKKERTHTHIESVTRSDTEEEK